MLRALRALSLSAAFLAAALPAAAAQEAAAAAPQDLPPARDLVARYVAAIGGRDAFMKHSHIRSIGAFEMPAQGIRGDLRVVQSRDGRSTMRISVPGMGELAGGFDGTVGWSMNPMQGPRMLEGKELAQLQEDAGFLTALRESPGIATMETVEKTAIGGDACYKVRITYKSGRTSFDCYSLATGLIAGTISVQESPMGVIEVTTTMSDWKEFGGIRFATRMSQSAMGQQQVLSISDVVFDDAADSTAFELPEPIKAIAGQKKAP